MDFARDIMEKQGYGNYEPIEPKLLPRLYIAYRDELSEPTEVFHNNIRVRFQQGETKVVNAMRYWSNLTDKVRKLLEGGKSGEIGPLLDKNFDKRRSIYRLSQENLTMVETARSVGASAKFSGSGGAIVGTYADQKMFDRLKKALCDLRIKVIKPRIHVERRKART
jgi:glucuronokinase